MMAKWNITPRPPLEVIEIILAPEIPSMVNAPPHTHHAGENAVAGPSRMGGSQHDACEAAFLLGF